MTDLPSINWGATGSAAGVTPITLGIEDTSANFFKFGTSLYPTYATQTVTTATTTNGSPTIYVASAVGIAVGDAVYGTFVTVASGATIISIAATTVTMSVNAIATNTIPVSVQFGQNRFVSGSTTFTNTLGAKVGLFGAASKGHSVWPARYFPAANFPVGFPASQGNCFSISTDGNSAGFFASRTSDNSVGRFAIGHIDLGVYDNFANYATCWARYTQGNIEPGSFPHYFFNEESTLVNGWATVDDDPYTQDPIGNATNLRLDLGTTVDTAETTVSNNATAALQISKINTATAKYRAGITINKDALDTAAGRIAPAIQMGPNHSLKWFQAAATPAWSLYSTQSSGFASIIKLQNSGVMEVAGEGVQLRLNATVSGDQAAIAFQDNGTTKFSMGRQTDDTFFIFDTVNSITAFSISTTGHTTIGGNAKTTTFGGSAILTPAVAPSAPASGWTLYVDSGDSNKLKAKASNGTTVTLGTP